MDWTTKAAVLVLGLVLTAVIWWVLRDGRKAQRRAKAEVWAQQQATSADGAQDMGKHHGHHEDVVTVINLLRRSQQEGDSLRLAWPGEEADHGSGRGWPDMRDEFPTGVLPVVRDDRD